MAGDVGKLPLFDDLDPRAKDPRRDPVLGLAGSGAGVASDASPQVDQHAITFGFFLFRLHCRHSQSMLPEGDCPSGDFSKIPGKMPDFGGTFFLGQLRFHAGNYG